MDNLSSVTHKCIYHPSNFGIVYCKRCGGYICKECIIKVNGKNACRKCYEDYMNFKRKKEIANNFHYCSKCGTKIKKTDSYCYSCGNKLEIFDKSFNSNRNQKEIESTSDSILRNIQTESNNNTRKENECETQISTAASEIKNIQNETKSKYSFKNKSEEKIKGANISKIIFSKPAKYIFLILFNFVTFFLATMLLGFISLIIDPNIYAIPLAKAVGKDMAVLLSGILGIVKFGIPVYLWLKVFRWSKKYIN